MPELSQEELDQFKNDLRIVKFKMQEMTDLAEGRIKSSNIIEYRNTCVFDNYGTLDADHPLIIDFELIDEMTKLVSCKFSFKVRPFREGVKNI